MWRSLFIGIGIMALIFGFECLLIDSATLYGAGDTTAANFIDPSGAPSASVRVWRPKEWFPWALLSAGAVIVIYSFTLPRRFHRTIAD
tara:strand:- start:16419 stop:16682 length:264 start_codon:yes stop_codon:yes gene_type:complete